MRRHAFFAIAWSMFVGCSGSSGEVTENGVDSAVADTLDDTGAVDTSVAPDADAGDGFVPCKADGDCAASAAGKVCDVASGKCVPCTATSDVCAPSEHCDPTTMKCVAGCKSDEGCAPAAGDAGADADAADDAAGDAAEGGTSSKTRCDVATNTCVECTKDDHCAPGFLCAGNVCSKGCSTTKPCPTGETCCTGACVDVTTNLDHCGKCGEKCAVTSGTAKCEASACAVASCSGTLADCDKDYTNGCEVDTATSLTSCGACGTKCEPTNATGASCAAGACGYAACDALFADCDGNKANGCEKSVASDTASCGSCGNACPSPANAAATCSSGTCGFTCNAGFADCDGNAANGCEVDLNNSVGNCGMCGKTCAAANGVAACVAGTCAVGSCTGSFGDCNASYADGCETNTSNDPSHCGACGSSCPLPANGTRACTASTCGIGSCNVGFANCDGNSSNGCETNTTSNASHCGACGNACPAVANGTAGCAASLCGIAACTGTYRNCNALTADGCEVNSATDRNHCGACGNVCPVGALCNAGTCYVPTTCQALRTTVPTAASGTYTIDPDGAGPSAPFSVWCEMIGAEGWTLALKLDGTKPTFAYDNAIWTNTTLLNPTSTDLSLTEAKLSSFNAIPFTQLRLGMRDAGVIRWINVTAAGTSLQSRFAASGFLATSAGRAAWRSLVASPTLQPYCGQEGTNNAISTYARVRIGILGNQENDCGSPDSLLGFGAGPVACLGGATPVTTGNVGSCGSVEGDRSTATFGFVLVR